MISKTNEALRNEARCAYLNDNQLRRALNVEARRELYTALGGKKQVVNRYVCNIESDLRLLGYHRLADQLIDAVVYNLFP